MSIQHTKVFGIYHWDTFDNETLLIDEADSLEEAENKVQKRYGSGAIGPRIRDEGADQVDIVNRQGEIVRVFKVG